METQRKPRWEDAVSVEAHTSRLDGTDDELRLARLESIDSRLFHHHGVAPVTETALGNAFLISSTISCRGAEDNERLAVGEECAREVDSLFHLAFGRERAQRHELHQSLHAHLSCECRGRRTRCTGAGIRQGRVLQAYTRHGWKYPR